MTKLDVLTSLMSVLALLSSAWVWVLQRRRERPRLEAWRRGEPPHWPGFFYNTDDANVSCVQFEATLLFANLSALPDALLHILCRVKSKEAGWLPVVVLRKINPNRDEEYAGLPLELPPRQVVDLRMGFGVNLPDAVSGKPMAYLAEPLQLEVELIGLGERRHQSVVVAAEPTGGAAQAG
jgi:hypothetical protein